MKRQQHWYDYLWIASALYLALGFVNILFAWLGLICFFVPLFIAAVKGTKAYCNNYCGRGNYYSFSVASLGCHVSRTSPRGCAPSGFAMDF